jgi:hypothetical protein
MQRGGKAHRHAILIQQPGAGGIAVNEDRSLFAKVNGPSCSVCVYSIDGDERIDWDAPVVFGSFGTGPMHLLCPEHICFAKRSAIETLLIADSGKLRIVEITTAGAFVRSIDVFPACVPYPPGPRGHIFALRSDWSLYGISCTRHGNLIAVTLFVRDWPLGHRVATLNYAFGHLIDAVACVASVNSSAVPTSVRFGADGSQLLVADSYNGCVRTFRVVEGMMHPHAEMQCMAAPYDVLDHEGGGVVVACRAPVFGEWRTDLMYMSASGDVDRTVHLPSHPIALARLGPSVYMRAWDGSIHAIDDEWPSSLRCAWVTACVRTVGDI